MRLTLSQHAGPDTRYAPDAFARSIGKSLTFRSPDGEVLGTLVAAEVRDGGYSVEFVIEVPCDTFSWMPPLSEFSIGGRDTATSPGTHA